MKFIEISSTVCVNVGQIAWVSSRDDGLSSLLFVGGKEYPSDIPYKTILALINETSKVEEKLDKYLDVATIQTI